MSIYKCLAKFHDNLAEAKLAADYNKYNAIISPRLAKHYYIISSPNASLEASLKGLDKFILVSIKLENIWQDIALYEAYYILSSAKQRANLDKEPIIVKKNGLYHVFYGTETFGYPLKNGGIFQWNKGTYTVLSRYVSGKWEIV